MTNLDLEAIQTKAEIAVPGCRLRVIRNESPSAQHSLLVDAAHLLGRGCMAAR